MKGKLMAGALAGATLATGSVIPVLNNINSTNNINVKSSNEVLLSQPVSNTSGQEAVVVNGDNNLVLFNNTESQSVNSYLSTGEMLTITGHEGNFCKVTVHETGAVGYISINNAQIIESGINSTFNKNITDGSIINVSTSVHLRAQPDLNSGILKNLKNNTNIEVLGTQGQWVKVNINGTIGYIYESYVSIGNTASATANSSSTITTNSTNNTVNNNENTNVNKNTNSTTNEKVNTNTGNVVANSSSSSSASSSTTVNDKTTSNSTSKDQTHNENIANPEESNSQSNINISLNDSAYIKAAPKVDFHNGTNLENSSKTTEFNNKQIDNVTVLNKQNNYYEVKLADGTVGLVNQNYIVFSGNGQKSEYLNKLNDLSIKTYNIFDTETAQSSQTNMNIYSGQCAEMWEHQLKDMSNSLMNNLPQNKINQFKQSEEQFNANVNSAIKQVAKAYEGGSIVPLMENMYYQDLTEQRCFNLVNEYPELYNSTAIQNNQETTANKNNDSNSTINSDKTTATTNNSQKENSTNNSNPKETTATNSTNSKETNTTVTNNNDNKTTNQKIISSRTKSSPTTNNQNNNKEKYINPDKVVNESHNENENNSTNNIVNVKTGAGYSKINEEASNHAVSSSTLDNLIYTHINDTFAPCRNYVSYNEISNVINNGTHAQKEALIQKYGSTCLVVNLGTSNQSVTPELYYNGQFYYKFTCTNLYSLINNPNNKYVGVINANGQAPEITTYNNAVNNKEVFALGSSQPTWASSQINC